MFERSFARFAALTSAASALTLCSPARSQVIESGVWRPNGTVQSITHSASTIYIGGNFEYWGPPTRPVETLNKDTGALLPGFPRVAGAINDAVSDGAGGWFIVGSFNLVGGLSRTNAAHVLSDGTVTDWDPAPSGYGSVTRVERGPGVVYLCGSFSQVGGIYHYNAAAVDSATGELLPWNPQPDSQILDIAVTASRVYLSGTFYSIGGFSRPNLAAVDPSTGALDHGWVPPQLNGYVYVKAVAARGQTVYVGGQFTTTDSAGVRTSLMAVDAVTGQLEPWNSNQGPGPNLSSVDRIIAGPGRVYITGSFTTVGGVLRSGIAAIDSVTGSPTAWNPTVIGSVASMALQGSTVFLGGGFRLVGPQGTSLNLAAVDANLGLPTTWDASTDGYLVRVAISGNSLLVAGGYSTTSIGGRYTGQIAAMDRQTHEVLPWNVQVDSTYYAGYTTISALLEDQGVLYVGGQFTTVSGVPRSGLAALDATTGALLPWNPRLHGGYVSALASLGDTLYVGGYFSGLGGRTRNNLGAVSKSTAVATPWNPNPGGAVQTLGIGPGGIYAGGGFGYVGTFPVMSRNGLACFGFGIGAANTWDPSADSRVFDLDIAQDEVFVGGDFWSVGKDARNYLAAVDAASGLATPWTPSVNGTVMVIARQGGVLYVTGDFTLAGGEPRLGLAAFDATTGAVGPWNPAVTPVYTYYGVNTVNAIDVDGSRVYLGGWFSGADSIPLRFAVVGDASTVGVADAPLDLRGVPRLINAPNPFRESTLLGFVLPRADRVTLEVFDLAGRRVARLLDNEALPAGRHEQRLDARHLPSGIYMCRLAMSGLSTTRRLVRIN